MLDPETLIVKGGILILASLAVVRLTNRKRNSQPEGRHRWTTEKTLAPFRCLSFASPVFWHSFSLLFHHCGGDTKNLLLNCPANFL
jgi:hypothetical protein